MSQVFFAQSPLGAGETSRQFTLAAGTYLLSYSRDRGTDAVNHEALITLQQLAADGVTQNVLFSDYATGHGGGWPCIPDPSAGVLTIVNGGPGSIATVTVSDCDFR